MTAVHNGFDADARDADTSSDGEGAQFEEVESDAAEGGVGNGASAEGEVEFSELRTAEGEDFGGGVGESAAEGLVGGLVRELGGRACLDLILPSLDLVNLLLRSSDTQWRCPSDMYSQPSRVLSA